jgi:hypothetical protein
LSEQARYLSPAGEQCHSPLRLPADLDQARALHESLKQQFEAILKKCAKPVPWAV